MTGSAGPGSDPRPTRAASPSPDPGDRVAWALPGNLPQTIEPMLPSPAPEPFDSPSHIFEVIWDGVRALVFIERGSVRVQDRYGRDVTARYPELQVSPSHLNGSGIVLDGAIVSLDDAGRPDFPRLNRRLASRDDSAAGLLAGEAPVTFQAFDILYRNGLPVMAEPLRRRKSLLRQTVRIQGTLAVPDFVERDGVAFFEAARAHGLEGIVAKDRDSRYTPGKRSRSWLSMKVYQKSEFVIGGYTYGGATGPGRTSGAPFASLLVGQYGPDGELHLAAEVTGGFGPQAAEQIADAIDAVAAPEAPFAEPAAKGRLVFWCRPELVCTVRFSQWGPDGRLRFPLFEYLRPDVPPASCRLPETGAQ